MKYLALLALIPSVAMADPATEETVHQLTEIAFYSAMAICFCLGWVAGQQR